MPSRKSSAKDAPPLGGTELAAWRGLLNVHARVVGRVEDALADAGLPPLAWYDVLWALYRADGHRLRLSELAEDVVISRSWLSRLIGQMERDGKLRRVPADDDGRGVYAVATDDGIELLRRMWPVYAAAVKQHYVRHLPDPAVIAGELTRVHQALRAG